MEGGGKQLIEFNFKGIKIQTEACMSQHDYLIAPNQVRSRHDNQLWLDVHFWDFFIDGNFQELACVKSILNYFLHAYWKLNNKGGGRIELAKSLYHDNPGHGRQELTFVARQKDRKYSLQIGLVQDGTMVKWRLPCPAQKCSVHGLPRNTSHEISKSLCP